MKPNKASAKTATVGRMDKEFPVYMLLLSCQSCGDASTISFVMLTHVDGGLEAI